MMESERGWYSRSSEYNQDYTQRDDISRNTRREIDTNKISRREKDISLNCALIIMVM